MIHIDNGKDPSLLVDRISGSTLECREWNGDSFENAKSINFDDISESSLSVTHYYGLTEIQYTGFRQFVIGRLLRLQYLAIKKNKLFDFIGQFIFNKKKLVTKQRMELLSLLVDLDLAGEDIPSAAGLMTHLHTWRWIYHPDRDAQQRKLQLYINSFIESGELTAIQARTYRLNGKALQTLELYEEQERKHRESVIMQVLTILLTVAIAFLTAVQANIIKLPTFWDFN